MRFRWRTSSAVGRQELDDYVRSVRIDVWDWDEDIENEYLVARLGVDHILWGDAVADRVSLFAVCDNDSQGLHELHVILTEGTNTIREDLRVELPVDAVVFVHNAVFHPAAHPYRVAVLDAVFTLFGNDSLAVMWQNVGDVPEAEQVRLGLARVAGTGLVFRHNAYTTPYSVEYPRGMDIHVPATPEIHRWVKRAWRRLVGRGFEEE
ncbi:hypothetical protein J0H58_02610 [bacterium]|nr:hypothetical protein [bacterium]